MSAPSEVDLRRIFERSPIGMYRSTAEGRFVFVNPALVAMLGYASAEELLAADIGREVYVDPGERLPLVQRYLEVGVVDGVDVRWRRKDGEVIVVRLYGHAVGAPGDGGGFDVTAIDVTAQRAAEGELRARRAEAARALAKLRSLMAQLPAMVWTVAPDLTITSLEGTALRRGRHRDDVIGRHLSALYGDDPGHPAIAHHRRALAGDRAHYELAWDARDYLVSIAPMRDDDGAIAGVIGTAVDVTVLRRVERNLQHTQRMESLGVLAGGVAHDFNNLLTTVLGNAELALREADLSAAPRRAVESIRTAATRASELTAQLLAYSGRGELHADDVALGPLVSEMVGLVASGRQREIGIDVAPGLPAVRADAGQIRQVVLNLVTNAIDASPEGGGAVRAAVRMVETCGEVDPDDVITPSRGRHVAIEVTDGGCGMDEETRARIFDPFFTTKASGHGLGLAAVLGIVRGHGGGLRLASAPGEGARFTVLLPAGEATARATASSPGFVPQRHAVLVVDDDDAVRDVLCQMLEDLGYRALPAASGDEAYAVADRRDTAIHAAIVDLSLPRLGGAAVIAGLRARRPALPVVLTSGHDRDRAAVAGAAGFLPKPFRFEALEQLLEDVIAGG